MGSAPAPTLFESPIFNVRHESEQTSEHLEGGFVANLER